MKVKIRTCGDYGYRFIIPKEFFKKNNLTLGDTYKLEGNKDILVFKRVIGIHER